ncbi:unnamed protein product [Dicrocoelium dendriticum]|nr:unnamed protein product [Dicrocoelium dendriticum]
MVWYAFITSGFAGWLMPIPSQPPQVSDEANLKISACAPNGATVPVTAFPTLTDRDVVDSRA